MRRRRQVDADQDRTGIHSPDAGEIASAARKRPSRPRQRPARRIAAIYQEPAIFPDLNVAENIFISHQDRGRSSAGTGCTTRRRRSWDGSTYASTFASLASGLTVASQQAVEIAKALSLEVRVLIMDEPTARSRRTRSSELSPRSAS